MIRIMCLFLYLFVPAFASADVFKLNDAGISQQLKTAVDQDSKGAYFSRSLDENITSAVGKFNFEKGELTPALSQKFNFMNNSDYQINYPFKMRGGSVGELISSVENSPLMQYQYTSPAAVDLLKYYTTIAYLRLGIFYQQAWDLEKEFGGPLGAFHRQAIYDCLKESKATSDLSQEMVNCSQKQYFEPLFRHEGANDSLDILQKVFNRLSLRQGETIDKIKAIVPQWVLHRNGYDLNGPFKRIGHIFADYRKYFLERMGNILANYKQDQTIGEDDLSEFSLPTVVLTEQHIRDLAMMEDDRQQLLMAQWASNWAKAKTIEQYELALEWFQRAQIHPLIKGGFKMVVEQDKEFIVNELDSFKHQVDSYAQYAGFMHSLLDASESERLKIIAQEDRKQKQDEVKQNMLWTGQAYGQ